MSSSYATCQREEASSEHASGERASRGGSGGISGELKALRAMAQSAAAPPGTPVDLPGAIRAKFENSFGTDLSPLRLYRSQAVADAGAQAVAQGANVSFAPALLDFTSRRGQELLGHEISHVVARQRGEVSGSGFLYNPALEARADREGFMAAAGQRVSAPTAPLSPASAAPAGGPMQAKLGDEELEKELAGLGPVLPEDDTAPAQAQQPAASAPAGAEEAGMAEEADADDLIGGITGEISESANEGMEESMEYAGAAVEEGDMETAMGALHSAGAQGVTGAAIGLGGGLLSLGDVLNLQGAVGDSGSKTMSQNLKLGAAAAGLGVGAGAAGLGSAISLLMASDAQDEKEMMEHLGNSGTMGKVAGGLGLGAQALGLGININSTKNAAQIQKTMAGNADELQKKKDSGETLSKDQEMMRKIYKQSSGSARLDKISGSFDIASSALGMGSSIANLAGAAPVGEMFSLAGKGVDLLKTGVTDYEKDKFHKSTVEDELEVQKNLAGYSGDVDNSEWGDISEEEKQAAFLRHKGYSSGTADEAFEGITNDRAGYLLGGGASKEDRARFMQSAMIKDDADPENTSPITKMAVHAALGGNADAQFGDMFGNDFEAGAAQKAEDKKNGVRFGGMKRFFKGLGGKIWNSVKKAGGKVAGLGMGIGRGIKKAALGIGKGAMTAAKGIKNFATNADTRKSVGQSIKNGFLKAGKGIGAGFKKAGLGIGRGIWKAGQGLGRAGLAVGKGVKTLFTDPKAAWSGIKSGFGKAGSGLRTGLGKVGSGIKSAGKYIGGMAKTQTNKIKNWYNRGMEQLVMNKGSYDKMHGIDRFKWTLSNLPARIAYNFKGARDKTGNRLANVLKAQALMRYADKKRGSKAS